MKITDLHIDGFGVWSNVSLNGLSPDVTVFYGPNEAGKSTMLQFVRSICFGYSPDRRRFFPPTHGGRPGGSLSIAANQNKFIVARHDDGVNLTQPNSTTLGTLQVTTPEGVAQPDAAWRTLLAGLDEATFNNVFAVGLREIQELNTLSDTAASQYLYDISAGRDRVSLGDVLRELDQGRSRLIGGSAETPPLIADLSLQRDRLQAEVDDLKGRTPHFGRVAAQANSLKQECDALEGEIARLQQHLRVYDVTGSLRPKWDERQSVEHQLVSLGQVEHLSPTVLSNLDRLNRRLRISRKRHAKAVGELRVLKGEHAALRVNKPLLKQSPRIEVLAEQAPFITALDKQIETLEEELMELEQGHHTRKQQLGLSGHVPTATAALLSASAATITGHAHSLHSLPASGATGLQRGWSYFRPTASRLKTARQRHQEAQKELLNHKQTATEVKTQVSSKLAGRSQPEITTELEKAGNLVTQLRRRIQLEDRLKQLGLQKTELDNHVEGSYEEVLIPVPAIVTLVSVFAIGVLMFVTGTYSGSYNQSRWGWFFGVVGLLLTAGVGAYKWFYEHNADQHVDNCSRQLETLLQQTKESEQERDALDLELPKGGGPLIARLQSAEQQLASLQELLPLHNHKQTTELTARSVEERARSAEDEYQKAKQNWRKLLRIAGLDENLSPSDVAQRTREEEHRVHSHHHQNLAEQREQQKLALEHAAKREELVGIERLVGSKREEIASRRREHEAVTSRVKQLLTDAGLMTVGRHPLEQLAQLRKEVDEQRMLLVRRKKMRARHKTLRRDAEKYGKYVNTFRRQRIKMLRLAGVANPAELRRRADTFAKCENLRKQREELTLDINAALNGAFPEDVLREHLGSAPDQFDSRRSETDGRLQVAQQRYAACLQQRGELAAQSKSLMEDRRLQHKQLELACVNEKLNEATEHWQVLATTSNLLENTRREFETERQPETLKEASEYLHKLTEGRYRRVWTPLSEPTLRVDDSEGHTHAVEQLSRGTREQMFLALRLALVALYARRGTNLPLVLDDVLVNYDTNRARAAAEVLRDFAAEGHQLLIFTCHEHIHDLFAELNIDARFLPSNGDPSRTVAAPQPVKRRVRRERQPRTERPVERPIERLEVIMDPPQPPMPRYIPLAVLNPHIVQRPVVQAPVVQAPVVRPVVAMPPAPKLPPRPPRVHVERFRPELVPAPVVIAPPPVVTPQPVLLPPVAPRPRSEPVRHLRVELERPYSPPFVEHRRIDPPQERSLIYFQKAKWTAEEFDGELEDWVAVRGRPEDVAVRRVVARPVPVATAPPVVAIRQGYAPEIIVEQHEVIERHEPRYTPGMERFDDEIPGIA